MKLSELYDSAEFENNYFYPGQLGAVYSPRATAFRVWAPLARYVSLCLYQAGSGGALIGKHDLHPAERGVWELTLQGDFEGVYYTYEIINFKTAVETADPYAKAAGVNGIRSMVVDLHKTDPEGWQADSFHRPEHQTDAIVWEIHVGDFSNDPFSGVPGEWRGKYLAFTQEGTTLPDGKTPTCVHYLKELGVTHVQLLPVYDYGSIDESRPGREFNWGYDPLNFNVPEGSYSTDPFHGGIRITEFKKMVAALHRAGIGVVMDVVYNHTLYGKDSWFHRTVPYYYHRITPDGRFADGSACGNEVASERCMCRKYIVDSVLYWAEEYHLDGFRFDLMGLLDVGTMNLIRKKLDALPGGRKILMYGEPWYASPPAMRSGAYPADKQHLALLDQRIGVFSDLIRDSIRGDVFKRRLRGYVQGNINLENEVKASCCGWTGIGTAEPFKASPSQVVSYVSAHDNLTLWDKLVASTKRGRNYSAYDEEIVALNKLCAVLYFTAQGMPFLQAGEEFARTKRGMDNSFRASPTVNRLDWRRSVSFAGLLQYYRGLIQIRKAFPALRDPTPSSTEKILFSRSPAGTVAFTIGSGTDVLAVIVNVLSERVRIELERGRPGVWNVLADGFRAGTVPLGSIRGNSISVDKKSAMILQRSFEKSTSQYLTED